MLMPNIPFFFQLIVILLVVGFLMWLINVLPFIEATMKRIVCGVILFAALLWLLFALYSIFWGGPVAPPFHRY
jgi:hypothetical protein